VLSALTTAQKAIAFVEEEDGILGGSLFECGRNVLFGVSEPLAEQRGGALADQWQVELTGQILRELCFSGTGWSI
jgi:hypothetical protein